MKRLNLFRKRGLLVALAVLAVASSLVLVNQAEARPSSEVTTSSARKSSVVGVAKGESVRLNLLNSGSQDVPVKVIWLDSDGKGVINCNGIVAPNHSISMDLNGDDHAPTAPARTEWHVVVKIDQNADPTLLNNLKFTFEWYDNTTGRTTAFGSFVDK